METESWTAELMYQASTWACPYVRAERYWTRQAAAQSSVSANAAIIGAQIFVVPYVELRPEYRIWDTELDGYTSRWNLQLHIFY
jgi:hypothetical protein